MSIFCVPTVCFVRFDITVLFFLLALDVVEKLSHDARVASKLQQSFIQSLEKVISLQEFLLGKSEGEKERRDKTEENSLLFLLGEVFDMKAVAFYLVSILVAILFTLCERVAAARFWLFIRRSTA